MTQGRVLGAVVSKESGLSDHNGVVNKMLPCAVHAIFVRPVSVTLGMSPELWGDTKIIVLLEEDSQAVWARLGTTSFPLSLLYPSLLSSLPLSSRYFSAI